MWALETDRPGGMKSEAAIAYRDNGRWHQSAMDHKRDLIAEWSEGPVRTVTRKEIVPGDYGILQVGSLIMSTGTPAVLIGWRTSGGFVRATATELRDAIATMTALADALAGEPE